MEGDNVYLPNVAPDEGLSAPFNSWFTLFGQFFDHGLDLVNKGGSGTVFIPLTAGRSALRRRQPTNFMVLTRATVRPGPTASWARRTMSRPVNTTTAYVDQNQTYTSHSSHQVFLRQYVLNAAGDPVATGKLIEGANGGMATWGEVKAQARELLGIQLDRQRRRQRAAAAHRCSTATSFPTRTACRRSSPASAPTVSRTRRTTSSSRAIWPARRFSHRRRHPHRPCLPRRHRP